MSPYQIEEQKGEDSQNSQMSMRLSRSGEGVNRGGV